MWEIIFLKNNNEKLKFFLNFLLKEEGATGTFLYYVIGGSCIFVIISLIIYLVYRKRQLIEEFIKKKITPEEKAEKVEKIEKAPSIKEQNMFNQNENNENFEEKVFRNDDDEIKVVARAKDAPAELAQGSTRLSMDRSGSLLMPKMSNANSGGIFANLNTVKTSIRKEMQIMEDQENQKENENYKDQQEDQRKFSQESRISEISAHKVVLRNGQKNLVCFTNEHRSEPDNQIFNDVIPQNIIHNQEEDENKLSAKDIGSKSEQESSSRSEAESQDIVNQKPIRKIEYRNDAARKESINFVSKKFDIKNKRRITDFDENTKDMIGKFKVFKQDELQRDTKTQITDNSIAQKIQKKTSNKDVNKKNSIKDSLNKSSKKLDDLKVIFI